MITTEQQVPFVPRDIAVLPGPTREAEARALIEKAAELSRDHDDIVRGQGAVRRIRELGDYEAAKAKYDELRRELNAIGDNSLVAPEVDHAACDTAIAVAEAMGYSVVFIDPETNPDFKADDTVASQMDVRAMRIEVRQDRTLVGKALYIYYVLVQDVISRMGVVAAAPDGAVLDGYHNLLVRLAADYLIDLYTPGTNPDDVARRLERMSALMAAVAMTPALAVPGVESAGIAAAALAAFISGAVRCSASVCGLVVNAARDGFIEGALQTVKHAGDATAKLLKTLKDKGATVINTEDKDETSAFLFGTPKKSDMVS